MVYITQLVYLHPGEEKAFEEFEAVAIPLIGKHGGELLLRIRPTPESVVAHSVEVPYELHLVSFPNDAAFTGFSADPDRRRVLHLKERSVRSSLLVRGTAG